MASAATGHSITQAQDGIVGRDDLNDLQGRTRTALWGGSQVQMKGLAFTAVGRDGKAVGLGASRSIHHNPLLAPENIHVQQVVQASDGERTGIGVLEQVVIGPYEPAGFVDLFDGAKG